MYIFESKVLKKHVKMLKLSDSLCILNKIILLFVIILHVLFTSI